MNPAYRSATFLSSRRANFWRGIANGAIRSPVPFGGLSTRAVQRRVHRTASRRADATLFAIDQKLIRSAWDAELIVRERNAPRYALYPAEPGDAAVVAAAGGTLASRVITPVIIFRNEPDE